MAMWLCTGIAAANPMSDNFAGMLDFSDTKVAGISPAKT
jgi:hypothetical protein